MMLSHPHIVTVYKAIETPNHVYIVMEYCQKGNLEALAKDGIPEA
jgi:serine/threonine protein kinase